MEYIGVRRAFVRSGLGGAPTTPRMIGYTLAERQREIERIGKLIDDLIGLQEEEIRMEKHLNARKYGTETIGANSRTDNKVRD